MVLKKKVHIFRKFAITFLLPVFAPVFIILSIFFSYITYKITHPSKRAGEISPFYHGLPYSEVEWKTKATILAGDSAELNGWFIPGARGAPGIILCHGYGSNRSEVLDLAAILQKAGYYNILVFNLRGHGQKQFSRTSLGVYEKDDILGAINYLVSRREVEKRIGLWGASIGGYAALAAAAESDRVYAVVADSVFPSVQAYLDVQTQDLLGTNSWFVTTPVKLFFATYFLIAPTKMWEPVPLRKLSNASLLFITGSNNPALGSLTRRIYVEAPGKRDILPMEKVRDEFLTLEERKVYNERVLGFFRKVIPVAGFSFEKDFHKKKI